MPVLGAVAYEFSATSQPLVAASKEAIKAFEGVDKAAGKADASLKGVTKSHSALGGAIKGAIGAGGAVGLGLLTKHMLEGTKAGEGLNKILGQAGGHLKTFGGFLVEGLRPFKAWLTSTETGTKAVTTFEKGVSKAGEGFKQFDQGVAKGAQAVKGWISQGQQAAKEGDAISRTMAGAKGAVAGLGSVFAQGRERVQAWSQQAVQAEGATGKLGKAVSGTKESITKFGGSFKPVLTYLNDVGEGMTAVELGALGLTGKLGKAAVVATHFSDMLGMVGGGLALMGGKVGILGAVITTVSTGVSGLTGLMGGLVSAVGMAAEAIGERLLAKTEIWIERFAEAQVTVLGFNRAIKAYNEQVKESPIAVDELEKKMSALSLATGTATVDIRQATLRALELSKVTGLTSDQVEQLTERSVDLASAMHRDLWDAVWSVLDAMRGFPMMASGFGIALDQETLKSSEFTKALGGTYDALTQQQQAQVMFQELMKQSAWASGIAAEQMGTTLVGATRKSEQAFSRLHTELGKGAAVVWQPYTNVIAEVVSTFNVIPATLVQAYGALTALGGVALTTVGTILKLAGAMVTFNVGVMAVTKGVPLLGKGLAWLLTHVKGVEVVFKGWGQILGVLAGATLTGFGNVLKNTALSILHLVWAAGKFTVFAKVGLIIAGAALAVYGLVKAYKALFPTMQETVSAAHKEILAGEERIKSLKSLEFELKNSKKSEAELREEILKISKDHPKFLDLLNKEKLAREDIVKAIEKTIEKEKEKKSAKEGEALAAITKRLQEQKVELLLIEGERKKILEQLSKEEEQRKEFQKKGTWLQKASVDAGSYADSVDHLNKRLEHNAIAESKVRKEISDLEKELHKVVGVRKEEQKTITTTTDLMKKLTGLTQQEVNDIQEAGSVSQEVYGIIQSAYQRRFALIDEVRERERAAAEASRDMQQDISKRIYEYENVVLKQREAAHAAYDASLIQNVRKSTKDTVSTFLNQSGAYFDELQKAEKNNIDIHLRSLTAFKDSASTFTDAYRETATVVFNEVKAGSKESAQALGTFFTDASKKWHEAGQIGLRAIHLQQTILTEGSKRNLLIMSKDFAGFSETIQEAYRQISGHQENYLSLLLRAGPATQEIAAITVRALKETDKAYSAQIADVEALITQYKKYEKEQEQLSQLDLKVMNLRRQRLEAFVNIFKKAYDDMAERQRMLMDQQASDLQKLRSLEEERLQRSFEMEKVFRDLQIKSGEITMSEWEQWYADMGDLDAKFAASRNLTAEEREKIDKDLIASYLGMTREVTDAQGKVVISEKEVAQVVRQKLIPVWEDERQAHASVAAEVAADMAKRKADIAELGASMEAAKAGMVGLQEEHRKLSDAISKTEHKITLDMEDKATGKLKDIETLLKAVTVSRKIDLQVDWKSLTAMQGVFKEIERSLSRIGQLSDIAAGKAPRPPLPAAPAMPAPPAAPSAATGAKPVIGTPGEISTRGFQQGGLVQGLQEGGMIKELSSIVDKFPKTKGGLSKSAGKVVHRKDPRIAAIIKLLKKFGINAEYAQVLTLFDKGMQAYQVVRTLLKAVGTAKTLPIPKNIVGAVLSMSIETMDEQQKLYDQTVKQGLQQGGQVAGKIPGFGGGDKVLISALPGQFVIRKEAVQKYGPGMLAALSQVPDGKLGGFQPKQAVPVAVEPGEFIVPRGAVMNRGVETFERINKMREGGRVSYHSDFMLAQRKVPLPSLPTYKIGALPTGRDASPPSLSASKAKTVPFEQDTIMPPLASSSRIVTSEGDPFKEAQMSATRIEELFTEMFSRLEEKSKTSANRVGKILFENLYSSLKDRLIREERMG